MIPDICTSSVSPKNCGHRIITVNGIVLDEIHESEILPLDANEIKQFYKFAIRHGGLALATLLNRVVHGTEATNVKSYSLFGPGAAITKTNIGSSYVNVNPGLNGEPQILDFTGCTEFRLRLHANLIGTGPYSIKIMRDNGDILAESAALNATGEREIEIDWQPLPAQFVGIGIVSLKAQARSTTAADDPVFRSLVVGLR